MTEVLEMFGAETILMNRCENKGLFDKTVSLINDFKNYFKRHDQTIYENPSPGNDLVASTASGAHIVLFTTGRGTPFACPVPIMKISSNSNLANKKDNWIDFNSGVVAEGESLDMAIFKQGVTL